jgi:FHA domain
MSAQGAEVALIGTAGPLEGERVDVAADVVLGREGDVAVDDSEASRRHARLRPVERGLEIEDLGSTNGTWVNGKRIEGPTRLAAGDEVRLGISTFRVEVVSSATVISSPPAMAGTQVQTSPPAPVTEEVATPTPVTEAGALPPPIPEPAMPPPPPAPPPAAPPPPPRQEPVAPPAAASVPTGGFGGASAARSGIASRRLTPTLLSFAAIAATAATLIVYFAQR